ncbi:hypothetical protein DVDV_1886 [Desulfovibrio sp. DV]|uniref:hypothetical protein n=1 Tax=Desulfovibrio sp. DV TaxID=1844708 RepID=UPI00094B7DF8|nr:hypothetical protein [Desulfovibrio sp. DV]OLN27921.1 hypothetical protein DVDV_1886 [Desulfovibrio sp. DV]
MSITRQIASPQGLLDYRPELGAVAVEGGDGLTYETYFAGLEAFACGEARAALLAALVAAGCPAAGTGIDALVIRAEKHGALYHPASLTVRGGGVEVKLCVNVAATPAAVALLEQEAGLLAGLRTHFTPDYLPCPHAFATSGGMAFLLEDWFAGFHEFHQDGTGRVRLWDYDAGERSLEARPALEIYRQAAHILTRYYHADTGAGIGPWHHAAGDFVARVAGEAVAVRLITVRGYGAGQDFTEAGQLADKLAALAFFTNMTLRMRLDRVEGVGELVLAGEDVAETAVQGFVSGLAAQGLAAETQRGILDFLGSFSPEELARAGSGLGWPCPEDEAALLARAWPGHARALVAALARFSGR